MIDPGVGIEVLAARLARGSPTGDAVLMVHHRAGRGLGEALPLLESAVQVGDAPPAPRPLIVDRIEHGAAS